MRPDVIAELSCNHLGSLERALRLVDAAKQAGCDGIKIQCWAPDRMVADPTYVLQDGPWKGRNLRELYQEAHTPWSWIPAIFDRAKLRNLGRIGSVFDTQALQYLEDIDCPAYKIASFELVDIPLIEAVAAKGKLTILSTGMASDEEIWRAVKAAGKYASPPREIILLHCVSAYPAHPVSMNLQAIPTMRKTYTVPVGLSDHTRGTAIAVAAAALGATMIEKHFTLSRADGGPDAAFSAEPDEMAQLVKDVRDAYDATHHLPDRYALVEGEAPQRALRRSLYWARDIEPGTLISAADMTTARPALGTEPYRAPQIVGKLITGPVKAGDPVIMEP